MEEKKTDQTKKESLLTRKIENIWKKADEGFRENSQSFAKEYMSFLDLGKTERECTDYAVRVLEDHGYVPMDQTDKVATGDKVYHVLHNKTICAAMIGKNPICEGVLMIGSHTDSPRLDLRPNPLYEDSDFALFKTRYYGGIKPYHWVSIPLALHGVIFDKNNRKIQVTIGDEPGDPVMTVADVLPHLSRDRMQKKASEVITGEDLNLIIGSMPLTGDDVSDAWKMNILEILNQKYGITEEDFISAELEAVPTQKAMEVGLDRSLIGAYGQDDRICAYTSLMALLDLQTTPQKTAVCYWSDKEEIGSVGNTGSRGRFIPDFLAELIYKNEGVESQRSLRQCLQATEMLSADVASGVNPNFKGLHAANNAAFLGKGICLEKYTGGNGKGGASDANAEFVAKIRKLFNDQNIYWQTGEIGKMDQGGGGTIAQFIADLGSHVIDCGIPVIGMHSTFELASKADLYAAYLAYRCFFEQTV